MPKNVAPIWSDWYAHAYLVNQLGFGIGFVTQFHCIKVEKLGDPIRPEDILKAAASSS